MNHHQPINTFPVERPRRLRLNETLRSMLSGFDIKPSKLIWPMFIQEGSGIIQPVKSLPEQFIYSIDQIPKALESIVSKGIRSIILFPRVEASLKNSSGSEIYNPDNIISRSIKIVKSRFPDVVIFADIDLSEYTNHGHSGIIDSYGIVMNDETLEIISKAAVLFAESGSDGVAPSGMTDGQVQTIRRALDAYNMNRVLIMSYSTKFASGFYHGFRDTVGNSPHFGNRNDCQVPISDKKQAIRESIIDQAESADILMVKPALSYLDIIKELHTQLSVPLAAYNVSGEYSMIWHASNFGLGDRYQLAHETLTAMHRAGADLIITYWANQIDKVIEHNEK